MSCLKVSQTWEPSQCHKGRVTRPHRSNITRGIGSCFKCHGVFTFQALTSLDWQCYDTSQFSWFHGSQDTGLCHNPSFLLPWNRTDSTKLCRPIFVSFLLRKLSYKLFFQRWFHTILRMDSNSSSRPISISPSNLWGFQTIWTESSSRKVIFQGLFMRINIYVHGGPRKDRRVFPDFQQIYVGLLQIRLDIELMYITVGWR